MKNADLVERFAIKGYTKKAARMIIQDFADIIEECLIEGNSVPIHGLGVFSVRESKPKEMVELSGERRVVPAHRAPRFTSSARLRRVCRQGYADGDNAEDQQSI